MWPREATVMSDNICVLCNRDINLLGKEGCEECGVEYDPMQPVDGVPLDFNNDSLPTNLENYEEAYGELPLTPDWDGEDVPS